MHANRSAARFLSSIVLLAAMPVSSAAAEGEAVSLPLLQPSVIEYRWTFLAPEWVVEPRTIAVRVLAPRLHQTRIDYATLEFESDRRKVARVADFSCKYSDFWLPNECRTTWRDVYIDLPVPVMRRESVDIDVPRWSRQDSRATMDVPRLVWKEQSLVVSLPAVAVPPASRR